MSGLKRRFKRTKPNEGESIVLASCFKEVMLVEEWKGGPRKFVVRTIFPHNAIEIGIFSPGDKLEGQAGECRSCLMSYMEEYVEQGKIYDGSAKPCEGEV